MAITTPYVFTAGDDATSARLNTRSSAISELQSPPRCRAYQSAAQTLTTAVSAAVTLDAEDIDTEAIHSTVTNNSRMTIVTAGRYRVMAGVTFSSNATGYREVLVKKNGTTVFYIRSATTSAGAPCLTTTDEVLCSAGDYIEMYALQTSGGNLNLGTGSSATWLHVVWCSTT